MKPIMALFQNLNYLPPIVENWLILRHKSQCLAERSRSLFKFSSFKYSRLRSRWLLHYNMKFLKVITLIVLIASITSIVCGSTIDVPYANKLIGFGVVGIFFVVFPLFSYYRWKDKDPKDYMLTKENLDKMRENQKREKI